MLAEIYMLRLEAAARATATATTSSRFVPITLPALPHQTSACVSPTVGKPGISSLNLPANLGPCCPQRVRTACGPPGLQR
jgi:hypothetical protein